MKEKVLYWMMGVVMIFGTSMLTACNNDDNDGPDTHPLKVVYTKCDCDTGQKMWDPMAVFNAVEGDALFSLSDRGYVTLTETAQTIFHHDATGCCRYQYPRTLEWNAQMLEKKREMNKIH